MWSHVVVKAKNKCTAKFQPVNKLCLLIVKILTFCATLEPKIVLEFFPIIIGAQRPFKLYITRLAFSFEKSQSTTPTPQNNLVMGFQGFKINLLNSLGSKYWGRFILTLQKLNGWFETPCIMLNNINSPVLNSVSFSLISFYQNTRSNSIINCLCLIVLFVYKKC